MKKQLLIGIALFFLANSYSQTFTGSVGLISDDGQQNDFLLTVSNLPSTTLNTTLGIIQVNLDISHPNDSDLKVSLISPDGTTIILFNGIGGVGDNFTKTSFSPLASITINSGSAPFSSAFKPSQSLANLNNGHNGNGVWKLRITDSKLQDVGVLNNWSVTFGADSSNPAVFSTTNLPIVIINTNGGTIADTSINATMQIIDNGAGYLNNITDTPNDYNGNIAIRYRGHYSLTLPQKPYKIETLDAAFVSQDVSILGMLVENDWVFIPNYNDKVFMRNTLPYTIFSEMGHYATKSKYCEVVLDGSYQGIYLLAENIKRDKNRVDIAKLEINENSGINLTGGYIIKNDYWSSTDSWLLNYHPIDHPNIDVHLVYDYPKPEEITTEQKSYIQTFVNNFESALYSSTYTSPITGYRKYMDTNSFVDYLIVNELSRNVDGFKKSSYFNKDKDPATGISKLKMGPVWDFDWAWKNINECYFGATDGSGWSYKINDCGDVGSPGWFVRLMQDPSFQTEFHCRWVNLRKNNLSNAALFKYIDETALYLDNAQKRHFEKWGNLGQNTGAPEIENDPTTFAGQISKFKSWITLRLSWLDANIPGNLSTCTLSTQDEEINESKVVLYPNPTKEYFIIQMPDLVQNVAIEITIIDMLGRTINQFYSHKSGDKISVTNYSKGTYIVKVKYMNKVYQSKLIIE
jgi:subtilisin-like proprotein convertase family protein